ncbi:hypothetical protein CEXT_423861 [Caerostris extrusa]|uniref:Sleeping Beauty transposase HTH domain-containing protein n=1 Tax=Caerostris extrusa TaxID=172846 RepID=A0AAV4Q120_CAEEX|nr:hypothetical protein CEXT_423861 [Caerostris extrusa]
MPRSSELSDFEKDIIGYHKCGRSLRDISSELKYPKSTVAYVIKKWKATAVEYELPSSGSKKRNRKKKLKEEANKHIHTIVDTINVEVEPEEKINEQDVGQYSGN